MSMTDDKKSLPDVVEAIMNGRDEELRDGEDIFERIKRRHEKQKQDAYDRAKSVDNE